VAANMHNDPLVYFRTSAAGDIASLARHEVMVDRAIERRMTYPVFLTDRAGGLVFKYRDGGSGNGSEIYNGYDAGAARWRHLLAAPLADGEGLRSAYFVGPVRGPDGLFHIAWVWRDTPMAETNHDLSYARSPDLMRWQRADGTPMTLPITLGTSEIVDPVPVGGGMINNNTVIGFDSEGRAMIAYHKFDARGDTQIFVARRERDRWHIAQASAWRGFRWDFRGGGSLDMRLSLRGPEPAGDGRIRVSVIRDGVPIDLFLDAATLRPLGERPGEPALPPGLVDVPAGMQLNIVEDAAGSGIAIAWPTRPPNRDLPSADIPAPTLLQLVLPRR
jgi:hypothetical protein